MAIHWDDIEILRFIDACEQGERSAPNAGSDLLRTLAADRGINVDQNDYARFLHELVVLGQARLVTWNMVQIPANVRQPTPHEPKGYLDHMRDFALTYKGRNQAKGRVIYEPVPDPTEDDGRLISSLTLEQIANAISAQYYGEQAWRFLIESGISSDHVELPSHVAVSDAVLKVLVGLTVGGSGQRRELRQFVGSWLDGELHSGPSNEDRGGIEADFARQGWFVKDGRLVIGEPVRKRRDETPPTPALNQLHPIVWEAAEARWRADKLHDAVMAASKAVNAMLKDRVGRTDIGETDLVRASFSRDDPKPGKRRLRFPFMDDDQTRESMREGVSNFGAGCFMATRNPVGHLPDEKHEITKQEALEQLAAWSLLARWIAQAEVEEIT